LQEEFYSFELITVKKEYGIIFPGKQSLKFDHLNETNFHLAGIAALENDLEENARINFEKFIAEHPSAKKDFELLNKTKLQPDLSVVYPFKNDLKKPSILVIKNWWYYAAAACIALLIGYNFLFRNRVTDTPQAHVTETEKRMPPPVHQPELKKIIPAPGNSMAAESIKQPVTPNKQVTRENDYQPEPVHAEKEIQADENKPVEKILLESPVKHEPLAEQKQEAVEKTPYTLTAADMPVKAEAAHKDSGNKSVTASSWLLSKVSFNKISFNEEKDENGNVLAFHFRAGNFSVEKTKGK
jgi:hypothetical protein